MGLQAKKFEDLIAIISLYRPGPMASIPKYIERSRGKASVSYHTPLLEPILKSTYGVLVYQEQVLQVLQFSLRRGDVVARYSGAQYVLMLPTASFEDAQMVLERIVTSFKQKNRKSFLTLNYKVQQLDLDRINP